MSFHPQNFLVWAEIPVTDMDRAVKYYEDVLQTKIEMYEEGGTLMPTFKTEEQSGIAVHLSEGKPAQNGEGPTVYLHSPESLEDTLERVKQAGGNVVTDIITIPPGRFFDSVDLDGNSIGFFSYANATS